MSFKDMETLKVASESVQFTSVAQSCIGFIKEKESTKTSA